MNPRIQELYEQAHERKPVMVVDPQTGNPIQAGWVNKPMYGNEFNPEKFAELLTAELVEDFSKNFITVWYEQGLDIRGADLGKFLVRFAELNNV